MPEETTVIRNDDRRRYELHVGDKIAGKLYFRAEAGGRALLPHTEIDPAFEGRGLASILAAEALADLARRGDIVIPECPFVSQYLKRHDVAGLIVEWPDASDATDSAAPSEPA